MLGTPPPMLIMASSGVVPSIDRWVPTVKLRMSAMDSTYWMSPLKSQFPAVYSSLSE